MGKKAVVYLVILVVIVVVLVVSVTGKKEAGPVEGGQFAPDKTSGLIYSSWAVDLAERIAKMEGVDTSRGVDTLLIVDSAERRTIRIDPYQGVDMGGEGWVAAPVTTTSKGEWQVTVDVDEPGTAGDVAEVSLTVATRYAKGEPLAKGQKVRFHGVIIKWLFRDGIKPQVMLRDARVEPSRE